MLMTETGSHPSIVKSPDTSLESINIFQDASMELHKQHMNSRKLHPEYWVENDAINDDSKTFEGSNPANKVLGLG